MSPTSKEQDDQEALLKKNATIWAIVIGLVTVGLIYWILDSQDTDVRIGAALISGVAVAFNMYRKSLKSGRKQNASTNDDPPSE